MSIYPAALEQCGGSKLTWVKREAEEDWRRRTLATEKVFENGH
jgi:hypothetical protein